MTAPVSTTGAIAFVDVVGFTALTERYGDDHALAIVDRIEHVTRAALPSHAVLVKLLGDAALVWFAQADESVPTMLEIVRQLADGQPAIPTRASVNYGHVIWREADVIGRDVNVAARLIDLAQPGEVLCTATARSGSDPEVVRFRTRGLALLAGINRRIHVFAASPVESRSRACAMGAGVTRRPSLCWSANIE